MVILRINDQEHELDVSADMPLLWALRDVVGLTGTKFGCGVALCGACTVHLDGRPIRSCITPVANVVGKAVTTIEAIGDTPSGKKIQEAWLGIEVVQCGYCQSGQIMSAAALIEKIRTPPTPKLMRPCPAISAAAAPTRAFGLLSNTLHNPLESGLEGVVMGLARLLKSHERQEGRFLNRYFAESLPRDECGGRRWNARWVLSAPVGACWSRAHEC